MSNASWSSLVETFLTYRTYVLWAYGFVSESAQLAL